MRHHMPALAASVASAIHDGVEIPHCWFGRHPLDEARVSWRVRLRQLWRSDGFSSHAFGVFSVSV